MRFTIQVQLSSCFSEVIFSEFVCSFYSILSSYLGRKIWFGTIWNKVATSGNWFHFTFWGWMKLISNLRNIQIKSMKSHSFPRRQIAHVFEFYLNQSLQNISYKIIMRQPYFMNTNEGDRVPKTIYWIRWASKSCTIYYIKTVAKRYAILYVEYILCVVSSCFVLWVNGWAFMEVCQYCSLTIFIGRGTHTSRSFTLSGLLQFQQVHYKNDRCDENTEYTEIWIAWIYYHFFRRPLCVGLLHFMKAVMQCCLSRVKIQCDVLQVTC